MVSSLLFLGLGCPWFSDEDRLAVVDADGDGAVAAAFGGRDCDDADAAVGAAALAVHPDDDGDGFGAQDRETLRCAEGGGFVANAVDCDDTDPAVGAAVPGWSDGDGDGYAADTAAEQLACPGSGLATEAGDCDDAAADVHPGAAEDCLGTEDVNCDGGTGGEACSVASLGPLVTGTEDGVGPQEDFGTSLLGEVDVDGDGTHDVVAALPYGYALYAFSGVSLGAGEAMEIPDAVLSFEAFHYRLGTGLAAGDATGDGTADLLVGCPAFDEADPTFGAEVLVIQLPDTGVVGRIAGEVHGNPATGWFGYSLAWNDNVGGKPNLLVGAPVEDAWQGRAWSVEMPLIDDENRPVTDYPSASLGGLDSLGDGYGLGWDVAWMNGEAGPIAVVADAQAAVRDSNAGTVFLWHPTIGGGMEALVEESGTAYVGKDSYEGFGYSISVGDYDADGTDDLAIGAIAATGQRAASGCVFLFESAALDEGWSTEAEADVTFSGDDHNDPRAEHQSVLGAAVTFAGDMNGDGVDDLAMSAPGSTGLHGEIDAGVVYVAPGGLSPDVYDVESVTWARYGDTAGLNTGGALAAAGDLDDDGRADLVVGLPGWADPGGTRVGAFTLWFGDQL